MMRLVTASREESALGAAQERFVEALPRRIAELRTLLSRLLTGPGPLSAHGERVELLRRLAALHASARVFRFDALATSLAQGLSSLQPDESGGADESASSEQDFEPGAVVELISVLEDFAAAHPVASERNVRESNEPESQAATTVVGLAEPGISSAVDATSHTDAATDAGAPTPVRVVAHAPSRAPSTAEPAAAVDTVVSLLVVGSEASQLASALPAERFELIPSEPEGALAAARVGAPDVILVSEAALASAGTSWVASLRADPSTDLVPIVLVTTDASPSEAAARKRGVDELVPRDADRAALAEKLARLAGLLPTGRPPELGSMTLREVADRMADEIRRGLVDAAERGADEELSLGDGTELFAAVWASIARMRSTLVERSSGRVRFRDKDRRGSRSWLTLGHPEARLDSESDVPLEGRRILVADDDPAVRWFFQGLLEDAGAEVIEAPDGRAALELARKISPDLVITDILMPRLDGLSLSRELSRDPLLSETPVIFLSWKEDYLQRMRELRAGASAYLRKEEGASVILDRVREAFRPRVRFEARLREAGDVRGRVEGFGVMSILRSVARIRRDARVTFRDVYNLFEVEVRAGRFVAVVRTATDGSFARGERALAPLLGVTAGRFAVLPPALTDKPTVSPIGPEQIEREAARLGALVDAVSGRGLALADDVELDEEVLAALLPMSPPPIVDVVRRLRLDSSARRWLASGDIEPEVLEAALVELARRGGIRAVRGEGGDDRIGAALSVRRGSAQNAAAAPAAPAPSSAVGTLEQRGQTFASVSEEGPSPSGRVTLRNKKRREGPDETLRIEREEPAPVTPISSVGLWVIFGVTAIVAAMIGLGYLVTRAPDTGSPTTRAPELVVPEPVRP